MVACNHRAAKAVSAEFQTKTYVLHLLYGSERPISFVRSFVNPSITSICAALGDTLLPLNFTPPSLVLVALVYWVPAHRVHYKGRYCTPDNRAVGRVLS